MTAGSGEVNRVLAGREGTLRTPGGHPSRNLGVL